MSMSKKIRTFREKVISTVAIAGSDFLKNLNPTQHYTIKQKSQQNRRFYLRFSFVRLLRRKPILTFIISITLLSVISVFFNNTLTNAAYSAAFIKSLVPNAQSYFLTADTTMYNALQHDGRCSSGDSNTFRKCINEAIGNQNPTQFWAGGQYWPSVFLYARNNNVATTSIDLSTQPIHIQLYSNSLIFLGMGLTPPARCDLNGITLMTSSNFPYDNGSNSYGTTCKNPAWTQMRFDVVKYSIAQSGYTGSKTFSISGGTGDTGVFGPNRSSRYWFSKTFNPVLNLPSDLYTQNTGKVTVTITMNYRMGIGVYSPAASFGCQTGGSVSGGSLSTGFNCGQSQISVSFTLNNLSDWSIQTHNIARTGDTASDVAKNSFPTNSASLPFGNTVNAYPDQYSAIGHYAQQNGPTKTDQKVSFSFDHTNSPTAFNWGSTSASWDSGAAKSAANYPGAPTVETNPNQIQANEAGHTYCSQFKASPWSSTSSSISPYEGAAACVHVPYNYHITPTGVSNNRLGVDGGGGCVSSGNVGVASAVNFKITAASGKLANGHNATNSKTIKWRVVNLNTGAVVANTSANGTNLAGSQVFSPGQSVSISVAVPASNSVGAAVRYALEISDNGNWSTGASVETLADASNSNTASTDCQMMFGKSPSLQLNGADSRAQGNFSGSTPAHVPTNGSWSQYAEIANGGISNFGSAGFINNGDENTCKLWFANVANAGGANCAGNSANAGNFGATFSRNLPTYDTSAFTNVTSNSFAYDSATIDSQNGFGTPAKPSLIYHKGDLTLAGGDGAYQYMNRTIYVDGNITITGNITPQGTATFTSLTSIPNLTIIATGDIRVNYNVSKIESNLVSMNGAFIDCANSSDLSENGGCSTQLVINGAISTAKTPHFTRTYGAEDGGSAHDSCDNTNVAFSTPAECINYNPNLFLVPFANSQNSSTGGNNWQITSQTSLPARY